MLASRTIMVLSVLLFQMFSGDSRVLSFEQERSHVFVFAHKLARVRAGRRAGRYDDYYAPENTYIDYYNDDELTRGQINRRDSALTLARRCRRESNPEKRRMLERNHENSIIQEIRQYYVTAIDESKRYLKTFLVYLFAVYLVQSKTSWLERSHCIETASGLYEQPECNAFSLYHAFSGLGVYCPVVLTLIFACDMVSLKWNQYCGNDPHALPERPVPRNMGPMGDGFWLDVIDGFLDFDFFPH